MAKKQPGSQRDDRRTVPVANEWNECRINDTEIEGTTILKVINNFQNEMSLNK